MFQKIKKLHIIIRIILACALAFGWMMIAHRFAYGPDLLGIPMNLIISAIVLIFIYTTFFEWNSSNKKRS
jgi:membrane protease YdiL (CAAX protease family)